MTYMFSNETPVNPSERSSKPATWHLSTDNHLDSVG